MESGPGLAIVIVVAIVMLLAVGITLALVRRLVVICGPHEVLVLSGKQGGPRLITGGRVMRMPIVERLDRFDVLPLRLPVEARRASALGGTRVSIELTAEVRVPTHDPVAVRNAVERFLGRSREEMALVCGQTLEDALRQLVAELSPEALESDPAAFEEALARAASDDLTRLGFRLESVRVKHVRQTGTLSAS
jgi:flotillin